MMQEEANILSIVLFGSYARNDQDNHSDCDLCVFTKKRSNPNSDQIKQIVGDFCNAQLNVVFYTSQVFEAMIECGSLFLWHLKLEGKVLFGEDYFYKTIQRLRPFENHHNEIAYHKTLFTDLLRSRENIELPNELDLALLFTIARNTCMILAHKRGKPVFGRLECYLVAKSLFPDIPLKLQDYKYLANWKIIYERSQALDIEFSGEENINFLIDVIERLLEYADLRTR